MSSHGIVIVGAGQSAAVAAHAMREHGYRGRIAMLGREWHRPYERPPLSKAVLVAAQEPALDVLAEEAWTRCNIELLRGSNVAGLDVVHRRVLLASGDAFEYEKCLLATGGEPRTLPCCPPYSHGVHYIRTQEDARRLRAALERRPRIAILGGGFLGLEVAHSALSLGASVKVLERATSLLDRFLPLEVSGWLQSDLIRAGAQIQLGTSVRDVTPVDTGGFLVATDDGGLFEVQEVVVAIGLSANDGLARKSGLEIAPGGGVLVDGSCRTSNEHVYACGDCASQQRIGQSQPTRLESWQNANQQARIAAAAILGASPPKPTVPWFWTDQGEHNIQMLGLPAGDLEYVRRGDPANAKALWVGHRGNVPVHAVGINAGSDLIALRPFFERGQPIPLQDIRQDKLNLRAWAKQQLLVDRAVPH